MLFSKYKLLLTVMKKQLGKLGGSLTFPWNLLLV